MAGESPSFYFTDTAIARSTFYPHVTVLAMPSKQNNGRPGKHSAKLDSGSERSAVAPADKHPNGIKKRTPASFAPALRRESGEETLYRGKLLRNPT
jgi:hypothetical protein